jgi:PQQ-dependent dehydrogenase (s-GDH family)
MLKSKLGNRMITLIFGLLTLSMIPAILANSSFMIQSSSAQAQTEERILPSPPTADTNQQQDSDESQQQQLLPMQNGFSVRILATNFSAPHNILYGPDGALWITERLGKNITRVDPSNGSRLSSMEVPDVWQSEGQDGLMGMAFDPDFNNTNYIYVAYTYAGEVGDDVDRRAKITRFTYDPATSTIGEPFDLISGLHASVDHNSGRMAFGPDGMLYYTIGDQGNNQLSRYCFNIEAQDLPTAEEIAAQDWGSYQGKVLRMKPDGSIPEDNPEINGVRSHIFTYGHRNPQGLEVGPNGDLYVAEHGPSSDDEVSRLQAGGNYGWPYVSGFQDGQAYQYVNWSAAENCEELEYDNLPPYPPGLPVMNESEFKAENFVEPIATFYTVGNDYNFTNDNCGALAFICNPTVAPSSLRLYTSDAIPGWNGTFLMTTLKAGRIFHLTLNEEGTALAQQPEELFRSENRYRDLAFDPDGRTIYVITDSFGAAQNIEGGATTELWTPGSVIAFRYEGGGNSTTTTGH